MVQVLDNPWRGAGLGGAGLLPLDDAAGVAALLAQCPVHRATPLLDLPELAARLGVARLWLKDERGRMGLGSFKALGAAHAIAREAAEGTGDWAQRLAGRVYVTASAGNHGLSVAAGARVFGARAVIYLARPVPEGFAARLEAKGAEVRRAGETYEQSMAAATAAARDEGAVLLSDSSWPGYTGPPLRVMEGYLQLAAEAAAQVEAAPSHIVLQAGVGGLAAAVAAHARRVWGEGPQVIVVEPEVAPALWAAIRAGHPVETAGPESAMGRLDCKMASMIALAGLARDADQFVMISEAEALRAVEEVAVHGLESTPSGVAGLAALLAGIALPRDARVLAILSEGPEAG